MIRTLRTVLALLALCVAAVSPLAATQAQSAAKPEDQDDKDIKAYVIDETKFHAITGSFDDVAACRKQNRPAWDQMTNDPAYADAGLTQKAKMLDAKVPQCTALLKKHNLDSREYLIAIESLNGATSVVMMRKRNMTVPAAKAAENVSPATLSFVESHYEEIEKWRQSIIAKTQGQQQPPPPQK